MNDEQSANKKNGTPKSPETLRDGAQCMVIHCMEPSFNTPGAQGRKDNFIEPILVGAGVRIDKGYKHDRRWLKDRLQLPGIIRRYAVDDFGYRAVIEESLGLAIDVHSPEMIILIDHTNCGERFLHFRQTLGRNPTAEEEAEHIAASLTAAAETIKAWFDARHGDGDLRIIRAVGIVTGEHAANQRRLDRVVSLDHYLSVVLPERKPKEAEVVSKPEATASP